MCTFAPVFFLKPNLTLRCFTIPFKDYFRRLLPAILVIAVFGVSNAQSPNPVSDSGKQVELQEVWIRAIAPEQHSDIRQHFTAGQQRVEVDSVWLSLYNSRSIQELLVEQSPVFIKSFGVNSMATPSFRGASAAQSAVLWNGVPIANPALGVTDISVLQTGLFDQIDLQYGSSSALFGSGNVGGALLLEQAAPDFLKQRHLEAGLSIGSFGRYNYQLKGQLETPRYRIDWRGFYQVARNDFSYRKGEDRLTMENAGLEGLGGLLTVDYNLARAGDSREHRLRAALWTQRFERQIPPALFEPLSLKQQTDYSTRTLLSWKKAGHHFTYYAKGAFSRMRLDFQPDPWLPSGRNDLYQTYIEAGVRATYTTSGAVGGHKPWPIRHETLFFIPIQYDYLGRGGSSNTSAWHRFRPAIALAHHISAADDRFQLNAAVRLERSGEATIMLPGLGGELRLLDRQPSRTRLQLRLLANIQKTYRQPSLNELYIEPGGNAGLKPEHGWSKDAGYRFDIERYSDTQAETLWRIEHSLSGFDRHIRDWIYWLGGAIWTPHNLAAVHSRGLETDNRFVVFFGDLSLEAGLKTAYVLATTTESYLPEDSSLGKQIPYTPRYNLTGYLNLSYRKLLLSYTHAYTGYRFVTVDESQYLAPYNMGTVHVAYRLQGGKGYSSLGLTVSNCWDYPLELVRGRPAPGRNYMLQLRLGF